MEKLHQRLEDSAMKITMKTPIMDCIGNLKLYEYFIHHDVAYQVVRNEDMVNVTVWSIKERIEAFIHISTMVTPVDVEFTFIPQLGDEVLL